MVNEVTPALEYTFSICLVAVILVQVPWTFYFIGETIQSKRMHKALVKNQDQDDTVRRLKTKHRNQLTLNKHLLTIILLEQLTGILIIIRLILSANKYTIQFNCSEYYYVLYIYVKYGISLVGFLTYESALEVLNLTTIFVKDVLIYNYTNTGMEKRNKWFLVRFVVIACLAISGVGIVFGLILVEILFITQLIQYYKVSMQLYRSLKMRYQDVNYEFGISSSEAATELKYLTHYRRVAIWCFIIGLNAVAYTVLFLFSLPQSIIGEVCIYELIANQSYTWIHSTAYEVIDNGILSLDGIFYAIFVILYLPVFVVYTLYYHCDKLLFVRVYKHRYHIRYSVIDESMGQLFV